MHNTIAYLKTCVYYSTVTQFLCPEKRKQNMCCFRSVTYLRNFICCWDEYFSMLKFPLIAGSPFYISCKCNVMSRITGLSKFCIFNFCEETALKTLLVVTWVDHLFHVRLKMVSRDHSWTVNGLECISRAKLHMQNYCIICGCQLFGLFLIIVGHFRCHVRYRFGSISAILDYLSSW